MAAEYITALCWNSRGCICVRNRDYLDRLGVKALQRGYEGEWSYHCF